MIGETKKRWEQLCALAETEQDVDRFLKVHSEIVRIMEEKEKRLWQQSQSIRRGKTLEESSESDLAGRS